MASTINAITTGAGGIVTTGDSTGLIALQSNGTTVLTTNSTGAIGVGSSPSYGTSGQLLTSGGSAVAPTWTTVSSGGMTLLGTLTPTVANSISLGSLTLTSYKALFISYTSLVPSTAGFIYVNSSSVQSGILVYAGVAGASGAFWVDLATGTGGGGSAYIPADIAGVGGASSISTATTTLYFRLTSTYTFAASGSIKVYGVA